MIDYLMKFESEARAKADAVVGAFYPEDAWRGDVCLPNVSVTNHYTGDAFPFWYLIISDEVLREDLASHPACMLVLDWSLPAIVRAIVPEGTHPYYFDVSPVFAGRDITGFLSNLRPPEAQEPSAEEAVGEP